MRHRACVVGGSSPHGHCQAHFAKRPKTIFSHQTSPKNPQHLAQCRSAFEMQCFCNCMLSSLLLTRGVASRDLHLWLPRGTSQNAIFSNKQKQKILILESVQLRRHCNSKATPTCASRYGILSAFLFFFVRKYCILGSSVWQPQMQVTWRHASCQQ